MARRSAEEMREIAEKFNIRYTDHKGIACIKCRHYSDNSPYFDEFSKSAECYLHVIDLYSQWLPIKNGENSSLHHTTCDAFSR